MRVLIIVGSISPLKLPYYEKLAQQPGMDLFVWFLSEGPSRLWDISIAGEFNWELLPGWKFNVQRMNSEQYVFNPSIIWKLSKEKYDVVVLCGWDTPSYWLAAILSVYYKIPIVLWSGSTPGSSQFGDPSTVKPSGLRRVVRPLVKWIVARSSSFVAYGTRAGRYLEQLGASRERIYYAWNTIDVDNLKRISKLIRPKRESLRQRLGVKPDQILLLFVGRLQPFKRIDNLITIFGELVKQNPMVVLGIVGNGPCEADLRRQAASLSQENIKFYGHVNLEQIPEYYVAADIFVLPSGDIWGLVVNEAMTCGLPIVAADTVGSTDDLVVQGYNGFVYPFQKNDELIHYLNLLINDEKLRYQMGVASEIYIQNFTYDIAVEALCTAVHHSFTSAIANNHPARIESD